MTIIRVGATKKYSEGWEAAFGHGKRKNEPARPAKSAAKSTAKKATAKKVAKASTKKKPAKKKAKR